LNSKWLNCEHRAATEPTATTTAAEVGTHLTKLTAFLELEQVTRDSSRFQNVECYGYGISAHTVGFSFLVAHYQVGVDLFHILSHQPKLPDPFRIYVFLANGYHFRFGEALISRNLGLLEQNAECSKFVIPFPGNHPEH
jgi:hypothetical protein